MMLRRQIRQFERTVERATIHVLAWSAAVIVLAQRARNW